MWDLGWYNSDDCNCCYVFLGDGVYMFEVDCEVGSDCLEWLYDELLGEV